MNAIPVKYYDLKNSGGILHMLRHFHKPKWELTSIWADNDQTSFRREYSEDTCAQCGSTRTRMIPFGDTSLGMGF